tara:strand:- start:43 stop:426 length:384 start_codon:yes stop_codon:yes gene_type:complete
MSLENGNITTYEWDHETVFFNTDEGRTAKQSNALNGEEFIEIDDHDHSDCLTRLADPTLDERGAWQRLVLVRDVFRNFSLEDRTWAYVEDNKLPENFKDSSGREETKVPKRFHAELQKVQERIKERS